MKLNLNSDNLKTTAIYLLIALVVCMFFFRDCGKPKPVTVTPDTKAIYDGLLKGAMIKKEIVFKDRVRTEYIDRWHKAKENPKNLPCDSLYHEIVYICDTIIQKDSSEIASYKDLVKNDSLVIGGLLNVHRFDSTIIVGLNKEVRKHKWQKRGVIALWLLREGVGVVSKIKN